jgi:Bardet-Biedl syndrome 1 protein
MLESEHVVLDPAVAVEGFWTAGQPEARLAVAAGAHVYIYRGVKIHYKLTLPVEEVHPDDRAVWCATARLLAFR